MLTQIELRHFKCFTLLKLPLSPLTLLSGVNASGKSSVLQALVLLHQTMREHEWSSRLMLNGAVLRLGTVADVIDQVHGHHHCEIALIDGDRVYSWEFTGDRADMSMQVTRFRGESDPPSLQHLVPPTHDHELTGRLRRLTYLTAERLGPRDAYPLEDPQLTPFVGPTGEHAASLLFSGSDLRVLDGLIIQGTPPTRLRQVEARMERFFPGCSLAVEKAPRISAVTLGVRTSDSTEFHRPIHTGFGLTQVLPIVVAALSAERDDLLLIENPEVHLHPAGQAVMGEFMAEVASAGVQVLVETHSDHVLNGIRRAVKNRTLLPDDVSLHFFRPRRSDQEDTLPQVQSPIVDADGNIDAWPEGFFDQFDKDMNHFAGWS